MMEVQLYIILLAYFILGGIIMAIINRGKELADKKNNWIKYLVYLVLINLLFVSILFLPTFFHYLCIIIIILGFAEIARLYVQKKAPIIGSISIILYAVFAYCFFFFSLMPGKYLFFVLFLTTVFDSFSQLSGQLFGKRKLLPYISPNKTYEGLSGGLFFALFTAGLIHNLLSISIIQSILLGLGVCIFAFIGDLLASWCKRKFHVKDFSKLLPGHGGILDRFDSFIAAGAFLLIISKILGI